MQPTQDELTLRADARTGKGEPMAKREAHPKAKPLAYWIAGYQEFCEPIIRAWLEDQGYAAVLPKTVVGDKLTPIVEQIEAIELQVSCFTFGLGFGMISVMWRPHK